MNRQGLFAGLDMALAASSSITRVTLKGTRILVVDDEDLMREVTAMMIEDLGGNVVSAPGGRAALEIFHREQESISCVVLDFSMPEMNGYELLMALRKIAPKLPGLMISGLGRTREVQLLTNAGALGFLPKPFQQTELADALQAQLGK